MEASRILWNQIFSVLSTALLFLWAATEWAAWRLAFQPELGSPWFTVGAWPIYRPDMLLWWWLGYDAYAHEIFVSSGYIAATGGLASFAVAVALSTWRAREIKRATTYGSARWAQSTDVEGAGLLDGDGVILGRWRRQYLRHNGPEHVLCFAPTRSGKGVGLVVPTLLTWPGSTIVHDIKGENWALTAGWRSKFGHVLLFDPTNPESAAYNPLLEVRRGASEVRDVQNIADILVDPEGMLERRSHWEKTSHSLLVGAILHVLYAEKEKSLSGVANFLSDPRRSIEATLNVMMHTPHLGASGVHPVVASAARELNNKSDNERSGVLSTAMSFLGLYRDPVIAHVTSRCDWRMADLMERDQATSLYLVVPPSDISRTRPLIRLILNQIGRRLTENLDSKDRKHRLLLMLDEFASLGRLDFFESSLAFLAGYGIKCFLIAQSLNQIERAYGQNNSVLDNCHVRVSFFTNDERTAKRVSDALGTTTEQRAMKNYAGSRLSPWLGHLMISRQETSRPLLTAGEIMQLPATDELVLLSGTPPIRARKARYYEDRQLQERIQAPPKLKKFPTPTPATNIHNTQWLDGDRPVQPSPSPKDTANGGIRREPELPPHEDIDQPLSKPAQGFESSGEPPKHPQTRRPLRKRFLDVARQASLDLDDDAGM